MARLGKEGISYFELKTTVGGNRATIHVVRISPDAAPFVIGPITNEISVEKKKSSLPYYLKMRKTRTVLGNLKSLLSKNNLIKVKYKNTERVLSPLWISNATFFDHAFDSYIYGPSIHLGKVETDIGTVVKTSQRQRWYFAQPKDGGKILFKRNSPQVSSLTLSKSFNELLGGAAALVIDGVAKIEGSKGFSFWASEEGGQFNGQWYNSGPIIAESKDPRPVNYLIVISNNKSSWKDTAKYLTDDFTNDINKIQGSKDQGINNAIVYDGGSSTQLWVRNGQTQNQQLKQTGVLVPNYLCLWG